MPTKETNRAAKHASVFGPAVMPGFWKNQLAPWFEKHFLVLCLCFVGIGCARIISTYSALSLTADEISHFACGLEYVATHAYRYQTEQPPLSRMMQALGPYLAGARPLGLPNPEEEGRGVIAHSGNVDRTIFLMRLGNLPFFLLACLVVCGWSWYAFGKPIAVVATGLFTLLPTVLADGGLATTDMALGADVAAAFFATILWAERPTWLRAMLLGLFTALACLSKFTALGYLTGAGCLALASYLAVRWPGWRELWRLAKQRAATFALAAATTALLIWGGYWFSVGQVASHWFSFGTVFSARLPAPEFFEGIRVALNHNREGHWAYLLGECRRTGWWYYFPVALAVKTPVAFLILFVLGTFVCLRDRARPVHLMPLAFSLGILLLAMRSRIDIGIRHVEPIYISFAIISALGFTQLLQWARTRANSALTAGVLVAWMAISGAVRHPDYLAYFNEFAGRNPENILVDSNYDWRQDLKLLAKRLHELGVKEFSAAMGGTVQDHQYWEAWYGLPNMKDASVSMASPGWTVVRPTLDKAFKFALLRGSNVPKPWFDQIVPTERVGSLLLYYTPPAATSGSRQEVDPGKAPSGSQRPSIAGHR